MAVTKTMIATDRNVHLTAAAAGAGNSWATRLQDGMGVFAVKSFNRRFAGCQTPRGRIKDKKRLVGR
jgi:hypothetical protein